MQLVKLFTGLEGQTHELEDEINGWVKETGVRLLQVSGNIAPQSTGHGHGIEGLPSGRPPSDLFVIVLYET